MELTEAQKQRIEKKRREAELLRARRQLSEPTRREAERGCATSARRRQPPEALTDVQKQRMEKNRLAAERRRAERAAERSRAERESERGSDASARRRSNGSKRTCPPASNLTDEQRQRMDVNLRRALERRKRKAENNGAVSHTSSTLRSNASTHASAARPLKRDELAKNGVVTPPPHRVSQGQPSASQSRKRQKVVKTLGSADSHFKNGRILTVKGANYRETNVLLGGAVLLVREPDNVSIYFCFF